MITVISRFVLFGLSSVCRTPRDETGRAAPDNVQNEVALIRSGVFNVERPSSGSTI